MVSGNQFAKKRMSDVRSTETVRKNQEGEEVLNPLCNIATSYDVTIGPCCQ